MIALNGQLAKIHQGLENVRLLPLILGYVPRPAIGEILPAKDIFHPKVFDFGSRGFGPKRIMCEAYNLSLYNHDYNVSKEVISALIEKNYMTIVPNSQMTLVPKTSDRSKLSQLTRS